MGKSFKKIIELLFPKGTDSYKKDITIISHYDNKVIYKGQVSHIPLKVLNDSWSIFSINPDLKFIDKKNADLKDHDKPYIIRVY